MSFDIPKRDDNDRSFGCDTAYRLPGGNLSIVSA